MLKIVVLDSGYGGELFADFLETELPVVDVIRVIAWRNAEDFLKNPKSARRAATAAVEPYIGRVDLIILANHLLSATSLKYFRTKYKDQQFIGFSLPKLNCPANRPVIMLTTKAFAHTFYYHNYLFRLKRRVNTLCLDAWVPLIDDGELSQAAIADKFKNVQCHNRYHPSEIILACGQFSDISTDLRKTLGGNIKIYDSFSDTLLEACKILKIRGRTGKRKH